MSLVTIEALFFYLNLRNWLIYYQYKWNLSCIQTKWQSLINPKLKDEPNWFIDNHRKYGNKKYMFRLLGSIHLFFAVFGGICTYFRLVTDSKIFMMGYVCIIIPTVFYSIMVCKTPSFDDYYYIHWESKMHAKILVILLVTIVIGNIIGGLTHVNVYVMISSPIICLVFFGLNYVSSFALISKNMKENDANELSNVIAASSEITLDQILTKKKAMDAFVDHLFIEYVSIFIYIIGIQTEYDVIFT